MHEKTIFWEIQKRRQDETIWIGIDVGGTAIKMGLFTTDGELIEKWEIKTNKEDQGSRIFDDIAKQIDEKLSERNISKSEVAGIGIGVPGPVKAD